MRFPMMNFKPSLRRSILKTSSLTPKEQLVLLRNQKSFMVMLLKKLIMMIFAFASTVNASFMLMTVPMVYVVNVAVETQNIRHTMTCNPTWGTPFLRNSTDQLRNFETPSLNSDVVPAASIRVCSCLRCVSKSFCDCT